MDNDEKTELINNFKILSENASISLETIKGILDEGAGFFPTDSKRLSLNPTVHKIIRMCRDSTSSKCNVSVSLNEIPDFKSNWLHVFLPIMQVVENSFEVVGDSGNIRINGICHDGIIEILVSNDGKPIPQEVKEKIFELGFSLKGESRGLGLKIAKRCLESIDGEIILVQSNEDETVFNIKFKPEMIYE